MINNYCKKCNVEIETSECSICGERAEVKSQLYWCEKCNVPLYDEKCCICGTVGKKSTTDIRPVFPEERLLLEILIGEPFKYLKSSVWNGAGNRYIVDGKSIKVSISDLMKMDSKVVISKLNELKETWVGIVQQTVKRGDISNILSGLTGISNVLGVIINKIGVGKTLLAGISAFIGRDKSKERFCPSW